MDTSTGLPVNILLSCSRTQLVASDSLSKVAVSVMPFLRTRAKYVVLFFPTWTRTFGAAIFVFCTWESIWLRACLAGMIGRILVENAKILAYLTCKPLIYKDKSIIRLFPSEAKGRGFDPRQPHQSNRKSLIHKDFVTLTTRLLHRSATKGRAWQDILHVEEASGGHALSFPSDCANQLADANSFNLAVPLTSAWRKPWPPC